MSISWRKTAHQSLYLKFCVCLCGNFSFVSRKVPRSQKLIPWKRWIWPWFFKSDHFFFLQLLPLQTKSITGSSEDFASTDILQAQVRDARNVAQKLEKASAEISAFLKTGIRGSEMFKYISLSQCFKFFVTGKQRTAKKVGIFRW